MQVSITRSYDHYADAKAAVHALEKAGISSNEISLVAAKDDSIADGTATGAGVGAAIGGTAGLLTGLGLMAIPGVGPVVAAGWLATTAIGAVAGGATGAVTGGIIDALVGSGLDHDEAGTYAESVRRGAALVSVRVPEGQRAEAAAILDAHRPIDVAARRREWQSAGWTSFDPAAKPYTEDQIAAERRRYL